MSSFVHFASAVARCEITKASKVVCDADLPVWKDRTGHYLRQWHIWALRIEAISEELSENIESVLVSGQTVVSALLQDIFLTTECLRGRMKDAQTHAPETAAFCKQYEELLNSMRENFDKMHDLLDGKTGVKDQLLRLSNDTNTTIRKLLDRMVHAEKDMQKKLSAVNSKEKEHTRLCAAILAAIADLMIDLLLVANHDDESEECHELAKAWGCVLDECSIQVFNEMEKGLMAAGSARLDSIVNALAPIVEKSGAVDNRSLFVLIESMKSRDTSTAESLIKHAILLMQWVFKLWDEGDYDSAETTVRDVTEAFLKNNKEFDILSSTEKVLECTVVAQMFDVFVSYGTEVQEVYSTLNSMLPCLSERPRYAQVAAAIAACRLFGVVGPNFERSEKLFVVIFKQVVALLNDRIAYAKKMALEISQLYTGDTGIVPFDEVELGFLCYHVAALKKVGTLDCSSAKYFNNLRNILSSTGCLPQLLMRTAEACEDEGIRKKLKDYHADALENAMIMHIFIHQLLLTLGADLTLRSENVASILTFLSEECKELHPILTPSLSKLYIAFRTSHRYLGIDVSVFCSLLQLMTTVKNDHDNHIRDVLSNDQGKDEDKKKRSKKKGYSPVFLDGLSVIRQMSGAFNLPLEQMPEYVKTTSDLEFVASMTAYLSQMSRLVHEGKKSLTAYPGGSAYSFAALCDCGCVVRDFIKYGPAIAGGIFSYGDCLSLAMDTLWPIAIHNLNSEDKNIVYSTSIPQLLEQMISLVGAMPQPMEEVKVPEELRQLRRVQSANLKPYAEKLIRWLKEKSVSDQAQKYAREWLHAVESPASDVCAATQRLIQSILDTKEGDKEAKAVFESFCGLSVTLALNMNRYTEEDAKKIQESHNELFTLLHEFLLRSKNAHKSLLEILRVAVTILTITETASWSPENSQRELVRCLYVAVQQTDCVRKNSSNKNVIAGCVVAVTRLVVVLSRRDDSLKPDKFMTLLTSLISNSPQMAMLNDIIKLISERLCQLVSSVYSRLDSVTSTVDLLDILYSKMSDVEVSSAGIISEESRDNVSLDNILEMLRTFVPAVLEIPAITRKLITPDRTSMENYLEQSSLIMQYLDPFTSFATKLQGLQQNDMSELRRLSRYLRKSVSSLVGMAEKPSHSETSRPDVSCLAPLAEVIAGVNATIIRGAISVVKEMFQNRALPIEQTVPGGIATFLSEVESVKKKYLASIDSSDELTKLAPDIAAQFKQITEKFQVIQFEPGKFPVQSVLGPLAKLGASVKQLVQISRGLTDEVVGLPDPVNADRISRFKIPVATNLDTSLATSMETYTKLRCVFQSQLESFEKTLSVTKLDNSKLVEAVESLSTDASQVLESLCRLMDEVFQPDLEANVFHPLAEQFASIMVDIQEATRNRILQVPGAGEQLSTSLSKLAPALDDIARFVKVCYDATAPDPEGQDDLSQAIQNAQRQLSIGIMKVLSTNPAPTEESVPECSPDMTPEQLYTEATKTNFKSKDASLPEATLSLMFPFLKLSLELLNPIRELVASKPVNEKPVLRALREFANSIELLCIAGPVGERRDDLYEYKLVAAAQKARDELDSLHKTIFHDQQDNDQTIEIFKNASAYITKIVHDSQIICQWKVYELEKR